MARKHLSKRERQQKARIALPASTIAPPGDVRYTERPTGRKEFVAAGGGPGMASWSSVPPTPPRNFTGEKSDSTRVLTLGKGARRGRPLSSW